MSSIKFLLLIISFVFFSSLHPLLAKSVKVVSDTLFYDTGDIIQAYQDENIIDGRIVAVERNIALEGELAKTRAVIKWNITGNKNYSSLYFTHPSNIKVELIPANLELSLVSLEKTKQISKPLDTRVGSKINIETFERPASETRLLSPLLEKDNNYRYDENLIGLPVAVNSGNTSLTNVIGTSRLVLVQLNNDIYSEVPGGRVVVTVQSPVYGEHSSKILIPSGSIIEGTYQALSPGQKRLPVNFNQITTPNGDVITDGNLASAYDPSGGLGLQGTIEYDVIDRILVPMAIRTIGDGGDAWLKKQLQESSLNINSSNTTINQAQDTDKITETIISDLMSLINQTAPVMHIPAGARFLIGFNKNIIFRENQDSIKHNGYDMQFWGDDNR